MVARNFVRSLAQTHRPVLLLVWTSGCVALGVREHRERAIQPAADVPHRALQTLHRFDVVREYIGCAVLDHRAHVAKLAVEIAHQGFDENRRAIALDRTNRVGHMTRPAIQHVIAIHHGENDVVEGHRSGDGPPHVFGVRKRSTAP